MLVKDNTAIVTATARIIQCPCSGYLPSLTLFSHHVLLWHLQMLQPHINNTLSKPVRTATSRTQATCFYLGSNGGQTGLPRMLPAALPCSSILPQEILLLFLHWFPSTGEDLHPLYWSLTPWPSVGQLQRCSGWQDVGQNHRNANSLP